MFWVYLFWTIGLIVQELNRNSLGGLCLLTIVCRVFGRLYSKVLIDKSFIIRFAGILALLIVIVGIIILTPSPYAPIKAVKGETKETDVVTVKQGQLTGVCSEDGKVEIYTGIPYAKPPVGDLRWKQPQDPDNWDGILKCDKYKPMSMQPRNPEIVNSLVSIIGYHEYKFFVKAREEVSEDSLYLNIWKPAGKQKDLPVLVYVHGGSLQTGQPWYADYSGEGLAREGVIVVNMGYRLGIFGFFADQQLIDESENKTTGNYGLLDQIKALQWVRDNIAAFGGDPNNVTLAGESAGGVCVSALAVSPLARGLFSKLMIESSTATAPQPSHSYRSLQQALKDLRKTMEELGVNNIEEMRKLPAEKIVGYANTHHHITVDGYVLEVSPNEYYLKGEYNAEKIMHGYNRTEGNLFLIGSNASLKNYEERVRRFFGKYGDEVLKLYPAENNDQARENWQKIYSAIFFSYGHYCQSRLALNNGIDTYSYYFTKYNKRLGYNHGGEEVYFYGNVPPRDSHYESSDYDLEKIMTAYFANFIKTGDPNGDGLKRWESLDDLTKVFELGENIGIIEDENTKLFAILDKLYGVNE